MSTHVTGDDIDPIGDTSPSFLNVTATAQVVIGGPPGLKGDSQDFDQSLPVSGASASPPKLEINAGTVGTIGIGLKIFGAINNHWYDYFGDIEDFSYQFDWPYTCTPEGVLSLGSLPAPVKQSRKGPPDIGLEIRKWDAGELPYIRILLSLTTAAGQGAVSVEYKGIGAAVGGTKSGGVMWPLQINLGVVGRRDPKPLPARQNVPWMGHSVYFNVGKAGIDALVEEPDKKKVDQGLALDEWCKKVRKALDENPDWEQAIRSKVPLTVTGFASRTWTNKTPQEIRALNFQLSKDRAKNVADRVSSVIQLPLRIVDSFGQGITQTLSDDEDVNERICKVWIDGDKLTKEVEILRAKGGP